MAVKDLDHFMPRSRAVKARSDVSTFLGAGSNAVVNLQRNSRLGRSSFDKRLAVACTKGVNKGIRPSSAH